MKNGKTDRRRIYPSRLSNYARARFSKKKIIRHTYLFAVAKFHGAFDHRIRIRHICFAALLQNIRQQIKTNDLNTNTQNTKPREIIIKKIKNHDKIKNDFFLLLYHLFVPRRQKNRGTVLGRHREHVKQ